MSILPPPPSRAIVPGEVRYLLEQYVGDILVRSSEFPLVASIDVQEGPALDLQHTFGRPIRVYNPARDTRGKIVDGFRERRFSLTGTSGADHRLGYDALGARLFASGFDLMMALRGFLRNYAQDHAIWEDANDYLPLAARAPEPVLVFRALREGESYSCDVTLAPGRRDLGSLWSYSADVRAWGPAPERQKSALESFFGAIVGAANTATAFIDELNAYVAYAAEVTDQTTAVVGTLAEPIRAVGRLGNQLGNLARAGQRLIDLPQTFVNATFDAARSGVQACADVAQTFTFGTIPDDVDAFRRDASNRLNAAQMRALEFLGARGVRSDTSSQGSGAVAGQINQSPDTNSQFTTGRATLTSVQLGAFESVQAAVIRVFGSTDRLSEVLALNGMPDAWTFNNGAPATGGSVLLFPAGLQGVPSVGVIVGADDLYGTDLALDLQDGSLTFGDLVMPGTVPNDFALVSGTANYDRATTVRLTTELGDYGAFPALGFPIRIGQSNANVSRADLASRIADQMLRDPRTRRVGPVQVELLGVDGFTIGIELFPVVGEGVQVALPVGGA